MLRKNFRKRLAEWLEVGLKEGRQPDGSPWTLLALAKASGVSRDTLWRIQNEKSDADEASITQIAAAFGRPAPTGAADERAAQLAPLPALAELSSTKILELALEDAVQWGPEVDAVSRRARDLLHALYQAAVREQATKEAAKDVVERALRSEIVVLHGQLEEAERKLQRAAPRPAAGGKG